jgi:hypothetical protein
MAKVEGTQRRRRSLLYSVAVVVLASAAPACAWSSHKKAFTLPATLARSKQSPTVQKPSLTTQKMLKNPGTPRVIPPRSSKLSNSVLADCDTLPKFPTAHGLLSPETVMRLEDLTAAGHGSDALVVFLDQYRRKGPLSCLSMLSDPDVLPHLTRAMRDIA